MKRGKREEPVTGPEYVLLVTPHINPRTGEQVTLIGLRTVIEFTAFLYDLVVQPTLEGHTLTLLIQGLSAPELTLPAMGPAEFRHERKDIDGSYDIVVSKHNKLFDTYAVRVSSTAVKVEKIPEKRFSNIVTRLEDW